MISKRYLNGGLDKSFYDILGLSIKLSNASAVAFQLLII